MTVVEQPNSTEMVDIAMLNPKFPEAVLRQIVQKIGIATGVEPRGFPAYSEGGGTDQAFIKSRFAVSNLIDRTSGELNLQAVALGFVNLPKPNQIHAIRVLFQNEAANEHTVQTFNSKGVIVDGSISNNPPGIEYLVVFRSQDPNDIQIPRRYEPVKADTKPTAPANNGIPSNVLIGLIVLASASAGLLVYFLVLSRGPSQAK